MYFSIANYDRLILQGFASGSFEADLEPLRLFDRLGIEVVAAQSFSKVMGLYSERVGSLLFTTRDKCVLLCAFYALANCYGVFYFP